MIRTGIFRTSVRPPTAVRHWRCWITGGLTVVALTSPVWARTTAAAGAAQRSSRRPKRLPGSPAHAQALQRRRLRRIPRCGTAGPRSELTGARPGRDRTAIRAERRARTDRQPAADDTHHRRTGGGSRCISSMPPTSCRDCPTARCPCNRSRAGSAAGAARRRAGLSWLHFTGLDDRWTAGHEGRMGNAPTP